MNTIISYILEILDDDIMHHGLFVQCVEEDEPGGNGPKLNWKDVLEKLLLRCEVEIGEAKIKSAEYVEFIAWRGNVNKRLSRAFECINQTIDSDKDFAYWLCLRKNVDRYEHQDSSQNA